MADIKRGFDLLPEEKRKEIIEGLIDFFSAERDEEIGIIAAEEILDHFLQSAGISLYNKGVADAVNLFKDRIDNLELDMSSLLKDNI